MTRAAHQPPTPREAAAEAAVERLRRELTDAEAEVIAATKAGDDERLQAHLDYAVRTVASWPAWKRGVFGRYGSER